jgi:predicted Zn-ribbon and HTH transcriptional regulator
MKKTLITLSLTALLAFNANAGTAKLVDYMVSGSGVVEILAKYGINGSDAKMVESYMGSALAALASKKNVTRAELTEVLAKLPVTGADANVRKELQLLLDKSEGQLTKEDVVKTVNNIIYLANRHGKSIIITCAECVNDNLAKNGFKFTVENIKNASTTKVLNEVLPKNPADLNTFISSRMRRLGFGDYSKVTPDVVAPSEEKSLALFLGLAENGSSDQKALIASIKKVSTRNGRTNIIDPKNPQKFWKIVADDMSPADMNGWTKTLNEVASRAEKDNVTTEEAFYRTLKEKAEGNDYLMKQYESLKTKRCFFR